MQYRKQLLLNIDDNFIVRNVCKFGNNISLKSHGNRSLTWFMQLT